MIAMRLPPVLYLLHLISIGMDPSIWDNMPEAVHSTRVEVDFVSAQVKLSFAQLVTTCVRWASCSSMVNENMKIYSM